MAIAKPSWLSVVGYCAIATLGCETQAQPDVDNSKASVQVIYQNEPLANVLIVLKTSKAGVPLTRSISDRSGRASFQNLPSPEPEQYAVFMESNSDGGWILDSRIMTKFCDSLRLKPFSQVPNQIIELPKRAVQSLSLSH